MPSTIWTTPHKVLAVVVIRLSAVIFYLSRNILASAVKWHGVPIKTWISSSIPTAQSSMISMRSTVLLWAREPRPNCKPASVWRAFVFTSHFSPVPHLAARTSSEQPLSHPRGRRTPLLCDQLHLHPAGGPLLLCQKQL